MKYRYLTFDCYGTLIDWKSGIEEALRGAFGGEGPGGYELLTAYVEAEKAEEVVYRKYREVLRRTALSLAGRLGVGVSEEGAKAFAASVPGWPAFADTAGFLREMGRRGYRRYILSNVDNDLLEGTIRRNKLEVDGYVTAEEVGSYKPGPAHWVEFVRRTGAGKGETLHVAQSVFHDVIPAQALGIDSAWVNRYSERLPPGAAPSIISDSLENLGSALG